MPPGGLRINPRGLALRRRTVSHRFAVFSRQSSVFSQSTSVLPIARRTPSRGALVHRRMVRCRTYLGGEPLWRVQDFRKLLVWRRAHAFAIDVRHAVKAFPRTGYADLKAQLVSAAESIGNNIVEGCGAATRKEFVRYLDISLKSTSEADHQLELNVARGWPRPRALVAMTSPDRCPSGLSETARTE